MIKHWQEVQVEFRLFVQIWTSVKLVRSRVTHVLLAWTFLDHTAAGVDPVTLATAGLSVKVKFAPHFLFRIRWLEWKEPLSTENKALGDNVHNLVQRFRSREEKQSWASFGSLRACLCLGTCFSNVPRTFQARKGSCRTAIYLFWKADLWTWF